MPIVGVIGIVGTLVSVGFSQVSWSWALGAVAAQVFWIVVYRRYRRGYSLRSATLGSTAAALRAGK